MKKVLLISLISIIQIGLIGSVSYLGYFNYQINKKLKDITGQIDCVLAITKAVGDEFQYKDYNFEIQQLQSDVKSLKYDVSYLRAEDSNSKLNKLLKH